MTKEQIKELKRILQDVRKTLQTIVELERIKYEISKSDEQKIHKRRV